MKLTSVCLSATISYLLLKLSSHGGTILRNVTITIFLWLINKKAKNKRSTDAERSNK